MNKTNFFKKIDNTKDKNNKDIKNIRNIESIKNIKNKFQIFNFKNFNYKNLNSKNIFQSSFKSKNKIKNKKVLKKAIIIIEIILISILAITILINNIILKNTNKYSKYLEYKNTPFLKKYTAIVFNIDNNYENVIRNYMKFNNKYITSKKGPQNEKLNNQNILPQDTYIKHKNKEPQYIKPTKYYSKGKTYLTNNEAILFKNISNINFLNTYILKDILIFNTNTNIFNFSQNNYNTPHNYFNKTYFNILNNIIISFEKIEKNINSNKEFEIINSLKENVKYSEFLKENWAFYIIKTNEYFKVFEGIEEEKLNNGIGHFTETACEIENVGLAGHNRGYDVNSFSSLKNLENEKDTKNKMVIYKYKDNIYLYKLTEFKNIMEDDYTVIDKKDKGILTLITCVENNPKLRLMVIGKLVSKYTVSNKI